MQNCAEDLQVEVARRRLRLYDIGMHPGRLGAMLNERIPMRPAVAGRLAEAVRPLGAARAGDFALLRPTADDEDRLECLHASHSAYRIVMLTGDINAEPRAVHA